MSSLLLKFSLYSSVLNIVFTPFLSGVARIFGYITILLFFVSAVCGSLKGRHLTLHKSVFYLLFAVIASFLASLPSLSLLPLTELIDKVVATLSFIAFYVAVSAEQNGGGFFLEDVFHINYLLCGAFLALAFLPFDFRYQATNNYGDYIFTMGLGNPNGVALLVMFSIVILMLQFGTLRRISAKVVSVALMLALVYVLLMLSSRTVLLCAFLVVVAFLLRSGRLFYRFSYLALLAPVLMIALQLWLYEVGDGEMIRFLGKALDTGRPEIYSEILNEILQSPLTVLFGDLWTNAFYNYHNGVLTVLASLGVFGTALYFFFWYKQLKAMRALCADKRQTVAFVAVLAVIIHSSAEAMGVVGTIPYCIFIAVIIKIAKGEIRSRYD